MKNIRLYGFSSKLDRSCTVIITQLNGLCLGHNSTHEGCELEFFPFVQNSITSQQLADRTAYLSGQTREIR